ncbi:hypothetical protein [Nocardia sp. XZ_19_369]|uniref:hypothetical protein n=1 Tax=Nocardia sp. XZ_19_369 TaxID=2769487 RepID=UPI00188F9EEB|nr:hypothetical protein [Nocardia sp. XZ_19_369]
MDDTREVSIQVPEEVAESLEKLRAAGRISDIPGFVAVSVQASLDAAQKESLAAIEAVSGGRPPVDLINAALARQGHPPLPDEDADSHHAGAA